MKNKKKSDFDKIIWEGTVSNKILSYLCIFILIALVGFISYAFAIM